MNRPPKLAKGAAERERAAWEEALREVTRPRLAPTSVTSEAHRADGHDGHAPKGEAIAPVGAAERAVELTHAPREATALGVEPGGVDGTDGGDCGDGGEPGAQTWARAKKQGRHGAAFGSLVHAAIGLVLTRGLDAKESVRRVARALAVGPAVPLDEAVRDVERERSRRCAAKVSCRECARTATEKSRSASSTRSPRRAPMAQSWSWATWISWRAAQTGRSR
ncbi:MAG: hypothetical protein IPG50_11500 [Myxococcales bacterium]|nr:hypothetical protein [Myxococcales bacterium]